jgi:uncharacterized damage-inducible protein DinB
MTRLADAIEQLEFTRRYTRERILAVPFEQWFTVPLGALSTIAWQVGHIAMAEYRLCLERLRPRCDADEALIADTFLETFGRGSNPITITGYSAEEIFEVFNRVHEQAITELSNYPDSELDLPPLKPHPLFSTRIAGLRYAPLHEMIHCGQIALLRRMLGHQPLW